MFSTFAEESVGAASTKSPELLRQIQFCKTRMAEKNLINDHREVFQKLTAMANPMERATQEHLKLYSCYVNIVKEAVTHSSEECTHRHLYEAKNWFNSKKEATDFRNMARGADAEAEA